MALAPARARVTTTTKGLPLLFYLSAPFFLFAPLEREGQSNRLELRSCFTTDEGKGPRAARRKGEKKRGMDEDRGYSVFHEPERGRPRGHGPLYTKIHRPMKDLCANMLCTPHGCYLPLCLPPNLIVVCCPYINFYIFIIPRARDVPYGSVNGSRTLTDFVDSSSSIVMRIVL